MLVYIFDPYGKKTPTIANAQLDLTLQYIDNNGTERVKHINMKMEDIYGKTQGKISTYCVSPLACIIDRNTFSLK